MSEKMGMKAIKFTRRVLRDSGMEKNLLIEMIKALPEDAKICGFGEYSGEDTCSILVESSEFYSPAKTGAYSIPTMRAEFSHEGEQVEVLVKKWVPKFFGFTES